MFQDMDQLATLTKLASQHDEWREIYLSLSKLGAIALTVPVSSVNCERDFTTMNRVRHFNIMWNERLFGYQYSLHHSSKKYIL